MKNGLILGYLLLGMATYIEGIRSNYSTVLRFEDILPEDPSCYDKMRPPRKQDKPTIVSFHVTVMGIDSINENSMTYAADIFFAQSWKDYRLRLPENMTSDYRLLEVDWLHKMWRPDSYFKNAKQVTFQTMTIPNHYVWLYQSKSILYMVKLTLTLSCAMNYKFYPHDVQECKLQMESLSHTTEDLIFAWETDTPLVVDRNIELPQFELVENYTADCSEVYSTGNFTCLEVVFKLKRRLVYYLFHTYMPTCLIVIMSWISFWIKPEAAPARVTLGVTSLLTLSTQHAKSQASLPPVSYIKIIDVFMSTCTIFVFLALMEYALVNVVLGDGLDLGDPSKKENARSLCNYINRFFNHLKERCLSPDPSIDFSETMGSSRTIFVQRSMPNLSSTDSPIFIQRPTPKHSSNYMHDSSPQSHLLHPIHCHQNMDHQHTQCSASRFPNPHQWDCPQHYSHTSSVHCSQTHIPHCHHTGPCRRRSGYIRHSMSEFHPYMINPHVYSGCYDFPKIESSSSSSPEIRNKRKRRKTVDMEMQPIHRHQSLEDVRRRSIQRSQSEERPLKVKKDQASQCSLEHTEDTPIDFMSADVSSPEPKFQFAREFPLQSNVPNNLYKTDVPGRPTDSELKVAPPPSSIKTASTAAAQKRRNRALNVDKWSRILFPLTFGLINAVYWIIFWFYL